MSINRIVRLHTCFRCRNYTLKMLHMFILAQWKVEVHDMDDLPWSLAHIAAKAGYGPQWAKDFFGKYG